MPLFRQYTQANSIQPTDAFVLDRIGTGTMYVEAENISIPTQVTRCITYVIDSGGNSISTGIFGDLYLPFDCTLIGCTLLADESGTLEVDIWMAPLASYPPISGNSITGGSYATLTATDHASINITNWATALLAANTLRYNLVSTDNNIVRLTVALTVVG